MLKLQRPISNRPPSKQRERFDFKFSNFQALQVPKGWDRLFVSIVSAESGRTIAKLGKALVKNGSCLWSEAISETIYISRHDSSKSFEDCLVKFVVSTGSTRSNNTLGEIIINMAQHATSRTSSALSQPLKKCSYGTILQVKIQRVTLPKSKIRDEGSKNSDSQEKVEDMDHFNSESKSHRSDDSSDGPNKPPREDPATSSRPFKSESEEVSETATAIINSFSSMEGSYERENSSMEKSFKSGEYNSHHYSVDDDLPSNQSPADSRVVYSRENFHNEGAVSRWSMSNAGSSRNLLEAAEDTIEELRAEAKMWERNARKLMTDLDISRKDFSDLSKKHAELGVELSAAHAENDGLKRQVEKVKEEIHQLAINQATREAPVVQSRSLQKELEDEIKYQQNLNDDLDQQLKQSQESNIELVSVLQELEETIEQQRIEIENLSSFKSNFVDLQNSMDRCSEENKILLLQLEKLEESEKNLKCDIQLLDEALREKTDELENERKSNREILSQREMEFHKEIASLEVKLSDYIKDEELNGSGEDEVNLMREEIESLREKIREVEKDCTELTDENLELLFKLKASNNTDIRKCSSFDSMTSEHPASCPSDDSEVSDPKYQVSNLEEELEKEESSLHFAEILEQMDIAFRLLMKPCHGRLSAESEGYIHGLMIPDKIDTARMSVEYIRSLLQELNKLLETRIETSDEILRDHENEINERDAIISEARKRLEESILEVQKLEKMKGESEENTANLVREMEEKKSEIGVMVAELLSKAEESNSLLRQREELEAQVSELQQKTIHLKQDLEVASRERRISSECIKNLQSEITSLNEAVSSHVSENTNLERNMKELKLRRHELENTLSGLQEENVRLEECVSDQEARVHHLEDEKREILQEMENHKSSALSLQGEISKLKEEMEIQISDLKQKSEDIRKQWIGAQEECEYLKEENETLHASATSSALEIAELQNLNSKLKRENQELHKKCCELVDQLSEMEKRLFDCSKKVESLSTVQDEFLQRENHLKTELDAIVKENSCQKEKLAGEESLHQLLSEKTTEFQKEVECLSTKLSDAREERENFSIEVSSLLEEKAELQASLQEVKREAESTKNELDAALRESESKVQDLTDQQTASIQSYERLMADYERILKLVANYRKVEEKLKTDLNDIELKHTISDYERQQLTKEMSGLKVQLKRITELEEEVSILKSELEECKLDKGKLELALRTISGDYEELKGENISLSEKVFVFEDAMLEFEECKRKKTHVEEKLLQMEKDLSAKEILHIQNEELKNEVTEMKRSNVQFQQKMYRLEMEKDECSKKVQALEDNLKQMQERNNIHKEEAHNNQDPLHERQKKGGAVVARERYERTKSSLETELRDLRERYLNMSLKYAEVEGQREDLVMKLKASTSGKKWF